MRKHVRANRGRDYYLDIGPWGPTNSPTEIGVRTSVYESAVPGQTVSIALHSGALGIRWYTAQEATTGRQEFTAWKRPLLLLRELPICGGEGMGEQVGPAGGGIIDRRNYGIPGTERRIALQHPLKFRSGNRARQAFAADFI